MFLVYHSLLQAGNIPGRWHTESAGFAFLETVAEYGMRMKSRFRVGYKCKFFSSLRQNSDSTMFWKKTHAAGGSTSFFWLMIFLASFVLTQQNPCSGFCPNLWVLFHAITIVIPINNPRALVYSNHYPPYSHPLSKIIYLDIHCCSTHIFSSFVTVYYHFTIIYHHFCWWNHNIPSFLMVTHW